MAEIRITAIGSIGDERRYRVEADGEVILPEASLAKALEAANQTEESEKDKLKGELMQVIKRAKNMMSECQVLHDDAMRIYRKMWNEKMGNVEPDEEIIIEHVGYDEAQCGREK